MSGKRKKHSNYNAPNKRRRNDEVAPRVDQFTGQRPMVPGLDDDNLSQISDEDTAAALEYLKSVRDESAAIPALLVQHPTSFVLQSEYGYDTGDPDAYYNDGCYIGRSELVADASEPNGVPAETAYLSSLIYRFQSLHHTLRNPDTSHPPADSTHLTTISTRTPPEREAERWARRFLNESPHPTQVAAMSQYTVLQLLRIFEWTLLSKYKSYQTNPHAARKMGCWAWSLLAAMDPIGELISDDVSVLRNLAKAAVQVAGVILRVSPEEIMQGTMGMPYNGDWEVDGYDENAVSYRTTHGKPNNKGRGRKHAERVRNRVLAEMEDDEPDAEQDEEDQGDDDNEDDGQEVDDGAQAANDDNVGGTSEGDIAALEAAKQRLLGRMAAPVPEYERSHATKAADSPDTKHHQEEQAMSDQDQEGRLVAMPALDMIISVVGEAFGQRDLLEAREFLWNQY